MEGSARLRSQVAIVRALADQIDRLPLRGDGQGVPDQLIEELTRLGCLLLEHAGSLAASQPLEDSGVFARAHSPRPRETESSCEGEARP
jgi:hypothetical protein